MAVSAWTTDARTADAIEQTAGMSRELLLDRLIQLAPRLTDEALRGAVVYAMTAPKRSRGGLVAIMGHWPSDESDEEIAAALKEIS